MKENTVFKSKVNGLIFDTPSVSTANLLNSHEKSQFLEEIDGENDYDQVEITTKSKGKSKVKITDEEQEIR